MLNRYSTLLRSIAVLALLGAAFQAGPAGPIVHWRLDETAGPTADDSAGTNDGTYTPNPGGPTPSTDVPTVGFPNPRSLSFDGVDDALVRATVTGLSSGNSSHSISAWVKVTALPANRAWILLLGNAGIGSHHWLINSAGVTQFGVWSGTQSTPALTVGNWQHVAMTFDGTTLKGYLGVTEITSAAATFNLAGVPLNVAGAQIGENFFNGLLDEVRVFNRALTLAEVQYLAGGNGAPLAPTLTATAGVQQVSLSWTSPANAQSYTLSRSSTPGGPYTPLTTTTGNSYVDSGLQPGVPVYYVVTAFHSAGGTSPMLMEAMATPQAPPPRISDHEEGILGDKCNCGSAGVRTPSALLVALALMALAIVPVIRR